ncbi:MAG: DUF2628 domain-containing protein [Deltaproteobacteria bacterium]|nr:DUF2628 domain-containing protein [Deltaproteobacteria bacterium]
MKKFSIFQHPTSGYDVVKNGWSWPAFFFTWIWAFVKKLWLIGVIVFLFGILASSIPEAWLLGEVLISIVMGVKGNELRVKRLQDSGYEKVATVEARTPDAALAAHLASGGTEDPPPPEGIVR